MSGTAKRSRIAAQNLCAVGAAERSEDPIGSALFTARALAVEVAPPWGASFYHADPEGTLQERVSAMATEYFERLQANPPPGGLFSDGYVGLFAIAPDPEWSQPGTTRAMRFTKPDGPFRSFEVAEYLFPEGSADLLDLVRAFFDDRDDDPAVERYRVPHHGGRELFVCTHGQVDICCGKFGFPLYAEARRAVTRTDRVWRASHFGGHRYAPTAWELPSGYMWGFLDGPSTATVMSGGGAEGTADALALKMRGSAGLPPEAQLLDRAGFEEFGWRWLEFERSAQVEPVPGDDARWQASLTYRSPEGETGKYEGEIVAWRQLAALGCGTEAEDSTYTVPEYRLEGFVANRGVAFSALATF